MNRDKIIGKRNEHRYTQAELAKKIGISEAAYRLKEQGKREFTENEIEKMCKILNETPDYFFKK